MALRERTCSKGPSEMTSPDPPSTSALTLRPHPSLGAPSQPVNTLVKWRLAISAHCGTPLMNNFWFGQPISLTEIFWERHCSLWLFQLNCSSFPLSFQRYQVCGAVWSLSLPTCLLPFISPRHSFQYISCTSNFIMVSAYWRIWTDANKYINQYSSGLFYWETKQ